MLAEGLAAVLAIIAVAVLFKPEEDFGAALKKLTPIGIFGKGYGLISRKILGGSGEFIALTILNAFILTTLDTATRISRYISEELFRIKSRYFSTFLVIILSAALAFSGKWIKIWPAFGASNQLVAALTLFVLSCWLLAKGKTIRFTIIPAFFMFVTTLVALILQAVKYYKHKENILLVVSIILIILAGFMIYEISKAMVRRFANTTLSTS
jgi:carbon starvation protein